MRLSGTSGTSLGAAPIADHFPSHNPKYDDANEVLSESHLGGTLGGLSTSRGYDNALRLNLLEIRNGGTLLQGAGYSYDIAGRLQTVSDTSATAYTATYGYYLNSLLVNTVTFKENGNNRQITTRAYDKLNRLLSIASTGYGTAAPTLPVSFGYQYNAANQRTRVGLADGSYWVYQYDVLGQVTSGRRFWGDGTPVAGQQFDYTFDEIGNRKQALAGGDATGGNLQSTSYMRDRLNRYGQRLNPAYVDIVGLANPTANVTVNGNTAYRKGEYFWQALNVPNSTAQYPDVSVVSLYGAGASTTGKRWVPPATESYQYDDDGNLTGDGRWTYGWDGENRLVSLTPSTGIGPQVSLRFGYDWRGRRIHKQVWDNTTWNGALTNNVSFVYDGWNLLAELNWTNNAVIRSFMWGSDLSGSSQGAGGIGGLLKTSYTTTNCFVAFDGNGNVAALADAGTAAILAQYECGPFGEVIRATGLMAKANPFRFSTKYQDDETDLVYYGYRYYNASTGRWISRDPSEEQGGMSLQCFIENNPLGLVDFLGLLEYRFEVTVGNPLSLGSIRAGSGRWGQPWWCADGGYLVAGASAYSTVTITSRNSPGGAGNTVDQPDPAGTIKLFLRDDCPGDFNVSIYGVVRLTGTGPQGAAFGKLIAGSQRLIDGFGTTASPFEEDGLYDFKAHIGKIWTAVAVYTPTVSEGQDFGKRSAGTAYGWIRFVSATK